MFRRTLWYKFTYLSE